MGSPSDPPLFWRPAANMIAITGTHVPHSPDSSLVAEDRVLTPETKFTTVVFVQLEITKGRVRPSNGSTTPGSQ